MFTQSYLCFFNIYLYASMITPITITNTKTYGTNDRLTVVPPMLSALQVNEVVWEIITPIKAKNNTTAINTVNIFSPKSSIYITYVV